MDIDSAIAQKLRRTREQMQVVGPLVAYLTTLGWSPSQMQFGRREWLVPKRPSEATKRERGHSFEGYPVNIALFDHPDHFGDPRHLLIVVECKTPTETAGVAQLETYMALEPQVQLGIWTNSADPSTPAVFVYRTPAGSRVTHHRPLDEFPRSGERISPDQMRQVFKDLTSPSPRTLRRLVEDMLDHVVANDSRVTRREDQLNQICNLLLLKLDSDKTAKAARTEQPYFRPRVAAAETAQEMQRHYRELVNLYPAVFRDPSDRQLRLADDTIHSIVERLAPYHLINVSVSTIATAFQALRTAALKQGEGQYFTPQQVIEAGVQLLDVQWSDVVIDPACGTGGFLVEVLLQLQRKHDGQSEQIAEWARTHVFGIDKDVIAVKLTKAIMQIAGDGSANCVRGDSVRTHLWPAEYPELSSGGFHNGRFTVVVTNPPFGERLKVPAVDARLAHLDIARTARGEYRDLEIGLIFLQRAFRLLRVGGRLGIILPETYFFSSEYRFVLDWIKPRLKPKLVLNVPMEAFQGFCRAKTNFYIFEKIADEGGMNG